MNKLALLIAIAATVAITGSLAAYAAYETEPTVPTQEDAIDFVKEFKEDVTNSELGFGQLDEQEGAYSP